jgi:hypothetical protein
MTRRTIRIGAGAGYAGDRVEPAIELAEKGRLDCLVFECLAERTIALAQQEKRKDPSLGYDPLLAERMRAVLGPCRTDGVTIVTNSGAANPEGGAERVREIARELGLRGLKIAAVTGDDVLDTLRPDAHIEETGGTLAEMRDRVVSANAYLGAGPLAEALAAGADVVVTGRAADTAIFMAPIIHAFGWAMDDWPRLGRGALVGHLLECAGQITGGYFADPGISDVPEMARLGFPIGEVDEDGSLLVTKVEGSGGCVTLATCKEQLLYEIDDPARYLAPDVIADFSGVTLSQEGKDRVLIRGGNGYGRPDTLKVCIGYRDGWIGEGQISYAGPGALGRARLALAIVEERLRLIGVRCSETRFDLVGLNALHGDALSGGAPEPYEVRARVVARTDSSAEATRVANEVETLYTNGPAGGGGATKQVREVIAVASTYVPREQVKTAVTYLEV